MFRHLRIALAGAALFTALGGHTLVGQAPEGAPASTDPFDRLHFRSIGPAQASGRIADITAYEANPSIFWVGSAHGGLWKTTNNGATFTPQFQNEGLISIGDVTVSQKNPDLVWVGSGESNNRQSASFGGGIWKSIDGGRTWKNMGLLNSRHIGRIVIDPDNNDIVLVAAAGPLFGPGGDRGVYKTTDGGATWKLVLKVDENTGANDIVQAFSDHRILYASMYQRQRSQCCMNGGGPGSGLYKSTDLGDTWTKMTGNGLPAGNYGRIGLDVYRRSANIVYAEIQVESAGGGGGRGAGGGGGGRAGGGGAGAAGGGAGRAGAAPDAAPAATGGEGIYRTDDGGATWRRVGNNPDGRAMYFSQVRIDPNDPDRVLVASVRLSISTDGGRTFVAADSNSVHDDKHAIWWDPANSNHVLIGTDGGAYQTWDQTKTWIWFPNIPVATFYHVGFDYDYPFNVCGGMQDNYDWCGPSAVRTSGGISNDRWHTVQGGDGFVTIMDARDKNIVYSESQDGNLTRKNRLTGESKSIRPSAQNTTDANGGGQYRFHWDTPAMFSPNDAGTLLVAGNKLFRSTDRGDTYTAISPDLTGQPATNGAAYRADQIIMGIKNSEVRIAANDGIVSWPTIVAAGESGKTPGIYYTGTDDGVVAMTKDGGKTWDKTLASRMPGFPKGSFVSRVAPSKFDAGTVYVTADNHRLNDYETHIWVSNDFGATFRSLNGNLKGETARTLTEDQRNPDVLYLGTETGLFYSLDRGKMWTRLRANFPTVRVDEITLHPRENAMLVATHGRGIWILDHLEPIQEYTQAIGGSTPPAAAPASLPALPGDAKLFSIGQALQWRQWDDRNDEFWGHQFWLGENPPTQAVIQMYFKRALSDVKLKITDALGKDVRELVVGNRAQQGIQTICWDMRVEPIAAAGGAPGAGAAGGFAGGGGGRAGGGAGAGGGGAAGANPADAAALAAQFGGGRAGGGRGTTLPQPEPGYFPANPCGGGGGGGRGGGGGGGGAQGPMVLPGTYNVALVVDGKSVETKTLKIVADPMMQQTDAQRKRYYDIAMDLHDMQRRGEQVAATLAGLSGQMSDAATKVAASKAPDAVKTQFDALNKEFEATRAKFAAGGGGGGRGGGGGGRAGGGAGGRAGGAGQAGAPVPVPAGGAAGAPADAGPGGGGPQGGGGAADESVLGRTTSLKNSILSFQEMPSDTYMKEYADIKIAMPKAIADANAFLVKAGAMSATLKKFDIVLTVPGAIK